MAIRAVNLESGSLLADDVAVCNSAWTRARGLLGTDNLKRGRGCLLNPCSSVHTFGMRYSIDCWFLDAECRVVSVKRALGPNRIAGARGSRMVLETAAGAVGHTEVGDRIAFVRKGP